MSKNTAWLVGSLDHVTDWSSMFTRGLSDWSAMFTCRLVFQ